MTKNVGCRRWLALVALAAACSQPLEDRPCPCVEGWHCCADQVCHRDAEGCPASPDAGAAESSEETQQTADAAQPVPEPSTGSRIYFGNVWLSTPGFAGGPVDQMTVVLDGQNQVRYIDFRDFGTERQYGDQPSDFPLSGSRDTVPGSWTGYTFHVVVEQADWSAAGLGFRYRATGLTGTPDTHFVEELSGSLGGQTLSVTYSIVGSLLTASIDARAEGVLSLSSG